MNITFVGCQKIYNKSGYSMCIYAFCQNCQGRKQTTTKYRQFTFLVPDELIEKKIPS